jgi:type IX secretion system PorP/SprF family membrane protein
MKKILLSTYMIFLMAGVYAQQHPMLSQYMFNGLVLNPAYGGSKDYISTSALYRKQWTGFEGAPESQTVSIHGPLKNRKFGLGLTVMNDKIGVTNRTDFYGSYAYHLKAGPGKFSFGIQGGATNYNAKLSDLIFWDKDDPVYAPGTQTNLLPNAGAGIYYYADMFYAGVSVPHVLDYDPSKPASLTVSDKLVPHQTRHYFVTAGYVGIVSEDFKIKPSVLIKYVPNAPLEADINCNVLLSNALWLGASYRTNDGMVGLIEYNISRQLRVGYAYDYPFTEIRKHTSGTHEVMIGYDFGYDIHKIKTPRYF